MSRCGLAGQAYTKVKEFADALGNTGLKINLSLMGKGVDADGNLILDEVNGMKKDDAIYLRNKYSKNVGTIIVCFNDEQIKAAMKSDYIDFIIPFHRSQWRKSQYDALGLPANTRDYTMHQNDRSIKENGRLKKAERNHMPNEYWDFTKSGRENAEKYIAMCNEEGKAPKFPFLLERDADGYHLPKGKEYDGYFKLLIDFKMYDNDGVGAPQMPVVPNFSMEECAQMLNDYTGGHDSFPVNDKIANEFAEKIKSRSKEFTSDVQYSIGDNNTYMSEADLSDYIKAGTGDKSKKIKLVKSGKFVYISSKEKLTDYVRKAVELNADAISVPYMKVSNAFADRLLEEFDGTVNAHGMFWQLNEENLYHSFVEHNKAKNNGDLDMSLEQLVDGLERINDGIIIRKIVNKDGTKKFTLALPSEEGVLIVSDVYGKKNGVLVFKNAWRNSLDKFKNNYGRIPGTSAILEEVSSFGSKSRSEHPINSSTDNIITSNDSNGNDYQMSLSEDTEGNKLTPAQTKFFRDSKVVDKNGKLKVMYHGTKADFTVFNPFIDGGVNGTAEGYGIYLADSKEVSEAYGGRIIEAYANIKKPASKFKQDIKRTDLEKLIKATVDKEAKAMVDDGSYDNIEDARKDTWISNYVYTYDTSIPSAIREVVTQILSMSDNDMDIVQEVMSGLAIRNYRQAYDFYDDLQNTLGIDGFETEWEDSNTGKKTGIVLAFNSNQIKNVDNANPNAALTTGIIGTALGVANGGLGLLNGNWGRGTAEGQQYVTKDELNYVQTISAKDSEIALLKSEQNTEVKIADVYERLITRINADQRAQSDWNTQQMVNNAQISSAIAVNANSISQHYRIFVASLQRLLSLSQMYVQNQCQPRIHGLHPLRSNVVKKVRKKK